MKDALMDCYIKTELFIVGTDISIETICELLNAR